jgi:hypothetical protein
MPPILGPDIVTETESSGNIASVKIEDGSPLPPGPRDRQASHDRAASSWEPWARHQFLRRER